MGTMNKILALIGITALAFICTCFYFTWHDKAVPDALIISFFGAISAEGFVMGLIKNVKVKMEREYKAEQAKAKETKRSAKK